LAINWPACDLITAFSQRTAIWLLKTTEQHISFTASVQMKSHIFKTDIQCYQTLLLERCTPIWSIYNTKKYTSRLTQLKKATTFLCSLTNFQKLTGKLHTYIYI
jgi:hypothetical protein